MIPNLAWQTIYLAAFLRLEHKLVFGFGCCRHFDFFLFNSLWTSSPKWLTVTFSLIYVTLRTWYLAWEHFVALPLVLLPSFSVNGNSLSCRAAVLPRSSQMILQPRVFTSPISDLQGGKQYPLLVGISRCRGESCRREVLCVGDLEDPPPDFKQKREEEGVCLQTWRWEMEPCVLTEAFQPCPRKAQKSLYFPQRRPGRGGRGVMREVKLSQCFPLTCKVLEGNSGCHVILFSLSIQHSAAYQHLVEGNDVYCLCSY